jgi:hypothetical protein
VPQAKVRHTSSRRLWDLGQRGHFRLGTACTLPPRRCSYAA